MYVRNMCSRFSRFKILLNNSSTKCNMRIQKSIFKWKHIYIVIEQNANTVGEKNTVNRDGTALREHFT